MGKSVAKPRPRPCNASVTDIREQELICLGDHSMAYEELDRGALPDR